MDAEARKQAIARSRREGGPFHRTDLWPDPGYGPLWSQKSDAIQAIQYAITSNRDNIPTDDYWCDAITFGQDSITIWINGKMIVLEARVPQRQRPCNPRDTR